MDPYIGEIRLLPYSYAPQGWLPCSGQELPIQQYPALASVLGNMYGGTPPTTFKLPNLQARAPLGMGTGPGLTPRPIASTGGAATVTLALPQLPSHNHLVNVVSSDSGASAVGTPTNATLFGSSQAKSKTTGYVTVAAQTVDPLNVAALLPSGDSNPHNNLPPYLVLNFCIAIEGVYPVKP